MKTVLLSGFSFCLEKLGSDLLCSKEKHFDGYTEDMLLYEFISYFWYWLYLLHFQWIYFIARVQFDKKTLSKTHTKTYLSVVGGLWWTTNAQKQKTIFLISNKKRITYSTCDLYDFHIVYYTKKTIIIYPITDKCSPNGLERSTHSKEFNSSKCK